MAMLAEKKRREKWCLNPRGKAWSDDTNKFGQKILEKMGWTAGQGLGANNQGPTEIVKVKKKDDSKGLGFKENGEEWLKTTSEYNELLDQLGSSMEDTDIEQGALGSSLEDRSKKSKARVHYHKFTRGKDLSRYSEKDLASIIGPEVVKSQGTAENNTDYSSNQVNKGSSAEYFNSKKSKQNPVLDQSNEESAGNDDGEANSNIKKCKKSRKSKEHEEECFTESTPDTELSAKKKKDKKNKNHEIITNSVEENDINMHEDHEKSNFESNPDVQTLSKKNSICIEESQHISSNQEEENDAQPNSDINIVSIKKEKIKSNYSEENNESTLNKNANNVVRDNEKVSKKKKNKRKSDYSEENDENSQNKNDNNFDIDNEEVSEKKKNKRKSDYSKENNESTQNQNANNGVNHNEELVERRKKKRGNGTENSFVSQFDHEDETTKSCENIDNNVSKKRKKWSEETKENSELTMDEKPCKKEFQDQNPELAGDFAEHCENVKKRKIKKNKHNLKNEEEPSDKVNETLQNNKTAVKSEQARSSKESGGCLEVLGRRTRLKKINVPINPTINDKYETEEFMAFDKLKVKSEPVSALEVLKKKNLIIENRVTTSGTPLVIRKCTKADFDMPKQAITHEYRLLTAKLTELNMELPHVVIRIENSDTLSIATHRKLKTLQKSELIKALLPKHEVKKIEDEVEKFNKQLKPKIDMINTLVAMEEKTALLAKELSNKSTNLGRESATQREGKPEEPNSLNLDKIEVLKNMSSQLQLLLGSQSDVAPSVTKESDDKSLNGGVSPLKKTGNTNNTTEEDNTQHGKSLQRRIEEKLRFLSEQMKMMVKGKVPSIQRENNTVQLSHGRGRGSMRWQQHAYNAPYSIQGENFNSFRGRGLRSRGFNMRHPAFTPYRGMHAAVPYGGWGALRSYGEGFERGGGHQPFGREVGHQPFGRGGSYQFGGRFLRGGRSNFWGRGRDGVIRRGRLSQNNYDAKRYAEQCRMLNKVPELDFKGVDLNIISGYAASLSVGGSTVPKAAAEPVKKPGESESKSDSLKGVPDKEKT